VVLVLIGLAVWVAKWKFGIPAKLTCEVLKIIKGERFHTLTLRIEEVAKLPAQDWAGKLAESIAPRFIEAQLPAAGTDYTYRVPIKKWRMELQEGAHVTIEGRHLVRVAGGQADLSIHAPLPPDLQ